MLTDRERGLAWVAMHRNRWGIDPRYVPICSANGLIAWGVPLTDKERAQAEEFLVTRGRQLKPVMGEDGTVTP